MSSSEVEDDTEGDGPWVLLPPHEVPMPAGDEVLPIASDQDQNQYIQFQLTNKLGCFSLSAGSSRRPARPALVKTDGPIDPQAQSLLFRLPAELRLAIYERLFRIPESGGVVKVVRRAEYTSIPSVLTLLLACRRLHLEAETIFYSVNNLCVDHCGAFVSNLNHRRRAVITKLTFTAGSGAAMFIALQNLHILPNLTSLRIKRMTSIRYVDISGWAVMATQIINELKTMKSLRDIQFHTPSAGDLSMLEMARQDKLNAIDAKITGAIGVTCT